MRNTLTLPFTTDGETDPRKATLGSYLTTLVVLLFDLQALQAFSPSSPKVCFANWIFALPISLDGGSGA